MEAQLQDRVGHGTFITLCGTPEPHSGAFGESGWRQRKVIAHSYKTKGVCETKEGVGKRAQDKLGGKPKLRLRQQQVSPEGRQRKGPEGTRVCSEVLVGEDTLARGGKHCLKGPGPSRRQPGRGHAGFGRRGLPLKDGR